MWLKWDLGKARVLMPLSRAYTMWLFLKEVPISSKLSKFFQIQSNSHFNQYIETSQELVQSLHSDESKMPVQNTPWKCHSDPISAVILALGVVQKWLSFCLCHILLICYMGDNFELGTFIWFLIHARCTLLQ